MNGSGGSYWSIRTNQLPHVSIDMYHLGSNIHWIHNIWRPRACDLEKITTSQGGRRIVWILGGVIIGGLTCNAGVRLWPIRIPSPLPGFCLSEFQSAYRRITEFNLLIHRCLTAESFNFLLISLARRVFHRGCLQCFSLPSYSYAGWFCVQNWQPADNTQTQTVFNEQWSGGKDWNISLQILHKRRT